MADRTAGPGAPKPRQRAPGAGRPPKPTQLHHLHGTKSQSSTAAGDREAQPGKPTAWEMRPPKYLDKFGRFFWNRHARRLEKLGLLTNIDLELFAMACERYSLYRRAIAATPKDLTQLGRAYPPVVAIGSKALSDCKSILVQFGVGPAGRSRTPAADSKPVDPAEDWAQANGY